MRILLIIIISFITGDATSQALKTTFTFNKNLEISEFSKNSGFIFGSPQGVISNSDGDIFVADAKIGSIIVFNKKGEMINKIGRIGRGGGEFTKINSLTLLPGDKILIYDFFQKRFTTFSSEGNLINTKFSPKNAYMKPEKMRYIQDVGVVLFYRTLLGMRGQVKESDDYLIHIISDDFSEIKERLVPISETIDITDNFEVEFEGGSLQGHFSVNDSTITLAPYFFRGTILQYSKKNNWELDKMFDGYVETQKTYIPVEDPRDIIGKGYGTRSNRFGLLAGIMNNESLGMFQKQNGDYLHLGLLKIGKEQKLYVNLFDSEGTLKAHGPVTNLHPGLQKNEFYRRMRFYWMDEQDQLYVIDNAEDGFYVYRGTIKRKN
ncbi:MAG: 6-bladed beta-propeller [Balneolaceae bacterium]|nr:6-bladed beta-propeller [Balneolaceae bacterium]